MTPIHLLFLFGALPAIAYADVQGLSWYAGKRRILNETLVNRLHIWIYVCLVGIIATGLFMVSLQPSLYLQNPAFWIKMAFVVTLVLNSVVIGAHLKKAVSGPFAALSPGQKRTILISGVVSGIAWVGAILGGISIG